MDVQEAMFFERSQVITDWMRAPVRKEGPRYTLMEILEWADYLDRLNAR